MVFGLFKSFKKSSKLVKISDVFREDYSLDFKSMMSTGNKREKATEDLIDLAFEDKNNAYIILELCNNNSMSELMKRRKKVTEPEARFYTYQLTNALVYLHGKGVIHRDSIKPSRRFHWHWTMHDWCPNPYGNSCVFALFINGKQWNLLRWV